MEGAQRLIPYCKALLWLKMSSSVCEQYIRLASVSSELDADYHSLWSASMALVELLRRKERRLIQKCPDQPTLRSYQSDSTSYLCTSTKNTRLMEKSVSRRGRVLAEFLLERGQTITVDAFGNIDSAIRLEIPRSVSSAKTAWNFLTASMDFSNTARMDGARGIVLNHSCFDRLMFSATSSKLSRRIDLQYRIQGSV
jgi:hypothetical protein